MQTRIARFPAAPLPAASFAMIALLALAPLLAGCDRRAETQPPAASFSPIVAEVNGEAITRRDLDAAIAMLPESLREQRGNPEMRRQLVKRLIRERLLAQKARELGLHLDPEFRQKLARIERHLLADAAREWKEGSLPDPSEAEIRAWYERHPDAFTTPEQIHARHILVADERTAKKLLRHLRRKPDDFAAIAARVSLDDNTKARGGDLNWFPRGVMVPAFEQVAFALKKGEIGGPAHTRFGWHIIQVLDRKPASRRPLDQVRDEIISILRHRQWEQWLATLEKSARIRLLDAGADATAAGADDRQ